MNQMLQALTYHCVSHSVYDWPSESKLVGGRSDLLVAQVAVCWKVSAITAVATLVLAKLLTARPPG